MNIFGKMKNAELLECMPILSSSRDEVGGNAFDKELLRAAQKINKNVLKRFIDIILSLFLLLFLFSLIIIL